MGKEEVLKDGCSTGQKAHSNSPWEMKQKNKSIKYKTEKLKKKQYSVLWNFQKLSFRNRTKVQNTFYTEFVMQKA